MMSKTLINVCLVINNLYIILKIISMDVNHIDILPYENFNIYGAEYAKLLWTILMISLSKP